MSRHRSWRARAGAVEAGRTCVRAPPRTDAGTRQPVRDEPCFGSLVGSGKEFSLEAPRNHDVVLFGATGFTGRLVAEALASQRAGGPHRFALAGRSRDRLLALRDELSARDPSCAGLSLLEADLDDPISLQKMASEGRVVLTTVGPYLGRGEAVVEACVGAGTHYLDLTGEGPFVDGIRERFHAEARDRGLRLVPACGFDCVPADVGALFTVHELPSDAPVELCAYLETENGDARGAWSSISAGSWHSALDMLTPGELVRQRASIRRIQTEARRGCTVAPLGPRARRALHVGGWGAPLPTIDTEVVLRSAATLPDYGPDFRYGHRVRLDSLAAFAGAAVGAGVLFGAAQIPPLRRRLKTLKQSGEGPDAEQRARNRFRLTFVGRAAGREVVTRVSGGDPGYGETSRIVSAAALTLAEDRGRLPRHTGVLTPAVAMGEALLARLRRAGLAFEVLSATG